MVWCVNHSHRAVWHFFHRVSQDWATEMGLTWDDFYPSDGEWAQELWAKLTLENELHTKARGSVLSCPCSDCGAPLVYSTRQQRVGGRCMLLHQGNHPILHRRQGLCHVAMPVFSKGVETTASAHQWAVPVDILSCIWLMYWLGVLLGWSWPTPTRDRHSLCRSR